MAAPYKYKPLSPEPGRIRLLRLFKAYPTDPMRCELIEASLYGDDAPVYQALSYTWGSNAVVESITIEEQDASGLTLSSTLHVTFNLHTALRYIRSRDHDLVLWIDAVCIDQQNAQEKGGQIAQMRVVYERAEQVLIWLGIGNLNSSAAMDAMCRFYEEARSDMEAWKSPEKRSELSPIIRREFAKMPGRTHQEKLEVLKDMLQSPWFQRVWIIQEVASARAASVHCGSRSVPADVFALVPSLLGIKMNNQVQAVLDVMPGHPRDESWWTQRRDLLFLLNRFASSKTSEPQDKVYALLGISSDASDAQVFRPDYEISFEDTVRDTLSFLILGSTQLHRVDDKIRLPKLSLSNMTQFADPPRHLATRVLRWSVNERQDHTTKMILGHHGFDLKPSLLCDLVERGGHNGLIEYIFQNQDVDPRMRNAPGETLLEIAVRRRDEKTAGLLLERAGVFNNDDAAGGTLASLEVARKHLSTLEMARRHISATRATSAPQKSFGFTEINPDVRKALSSLTEKHDTSALVQTNAVYRAEPKVPHVESEKDAALSSAVRNGNVVGLTKLAREGVYPSRYRDAWGGTLLSLAASTGSMPVTRFLLRQMRGAVDVNSQNEDGRTALSFAAEKGHLEVMALLMSHGANAAAKDFNGRRIVDWLEDATEKGPNWGSRLAAWRISLYGSELAM